MFWTVPDWLWTDRRCISGRPYVSIRKGDASRTCDAANATSYLYYQTESSCKAKPSQRCYKDSPRHPNMSKDTKIEMRTQKDWITFKTKFKGMAIRKGFKPALASPRPSGEALMVPDPSDATGRTLVPETPNQIATRLADWNTANSLCWAYLQGP